MMEVSEKQYCAFSVKHKVHTESLKVTEEFPDGSYSIMHHLGYCRSINMCCIIYTAQLDRTSYYIF